MENKWEMLSSSNEEREKIWTKNRTFAGDVWFRFRRKPTAIAGLTMIILLLLFALAGPMFTEYSYSVQDLEVVNIPPVMEVYDTPDGDGYFYITQSLKVLYVNPDKTLGDQLKKVREESDMSMTIFDYKGEEVGLYYGQKPYVMADPETKVIYPSETVRNASYLFGTDSLGRDILTRLMYGVRVSILVTVTMLIPSAIFMEAFLSFLGIGLQPPLASLGTMCNDASANLRTCPYQLFIPALVICLIMFAFNFVGDGLRDALDPKLKK